MGKLGSAAWVKPFNCVDVFVDSRDDLIAKVMEICGQSSSEKPSLESSGSPCQQSVDAKNSSSHCAHW